MRKVLAPSSLINAKSSSTLEASGNGTPNCDGEKGPYVTPFRKTFFSSTKKNFPWHRALAEPVSGSKHDSPADGIGRLMLEHSLAADLEVVQFLYMRSNKVLRARDVQYSSPGDSTMCNRIFGQRNSNASTTTRRFPCFSQRLRTSIKE